MIFNLTQPLISSVPVLGKDFTWTGGDGTCVVVDDGGGNWRIKFLSSGVFTPLKDMTIDAFLVGGGGGGGQHSSTYKLAAGGGGGYTTTQLQLELIAGTAYSIVVGAGGELFTTVGTGKGGNTSAFDAVASGGGAGAWSKGGLATSASGGSGGSGGGDCTQSLSVTAYDGCSDGDGGTNAGKGQGTTTREFGEPEGTLYSGGGGAYNSADVKGSGGAGGGANGGESAEDNTGGGGGGNGYGGSGIVIIRKHKEAAA